MTYLDEILDLIDHHDDFTRGDLQGRVEATVLNLLNGNHTTMLEKILTMGA
jgi:hypothetical protein